MPFQWCSFTRDCPFPTPVCSCFSLSFSPPFEQEKTFSLTQSIFKPEDRGTSSWSMRGNSLTLHCSTLPWALLKGRRSNLSFEWDIQEIWDFFHSGIWVSLLFPLHLSAWKLQPVLHRGSFMFSSIWKGKQRLFFFLFFSPASALHELAGCCIAHILLQDF